VFTKKWIISRKVTGPIPDGVNGVFHVFNVCIYDVYMYVSMDVCVANFKFESYPLSLTNIQNILVEDQRL
jgi:hypothetical protein